MKPRLFISSSTENADLAYALQECLEADAEITVWNQGIFNLSSYTLDDLAVALEDTDFGAFIFAPDDIVFIRHQEHQQVRDNVLFELGLFVGRLGRERSFVLLPSNHKDFRLPTDLLGITAALFSTERSDGNLIAALGPAANKIRKALRRLGPIESQEDQPPQPEVSEEAPPVPLPPPEQVQPTMPFTLSPDERALLVHLIDAQRGQALLWEYMYLNHYLVTTTQRVLDWFSLIREPIALHVFDAFWMAFIPDPNERQAIISALQNHYLVALENGFVQISPKGRAYVEWPGRVRISDNAPAVG